MARHLCAFAVTGALLATIAGTGPALAQKAGGVLKIYHRDSPASMSILEEATNSTEIPMMGVFNNLVLYKQDVPQNSLQSIVPDLATDWSWNEDGTELTFRLRQGVKWHDGHPFTANDVKCTWDLLLGRVAGEAARQSAQGLVPEPRRGHCGRRFHRDLPSANGHSRRSSRCSRRATRRSIPATCHRATCASIRSAPARSNSSSSSRTSISRWRAIRITGRAGRPYLDGIEYTVIPNRSTAILSFIAGKFDMTFPFEVTVPLLRDVKSQAPQAICELVPANAQRQSDHQP